MTPNHNVMFDDASVMWIDADYIYQNSKMPMSSFQQLLFSIPSKHRKMINDIGSSPSCSFPPNNSTVKYMVDIYGAAVLATRCPPTFSDQLLTTFVANNYANRQPPQLPVDGAQTQILDALEKLTRQSDLFVNSLNQVSLNQSNHFLEVSNTLSAVRAQNAQILSAVETAKDALLNRLSALVQEITVALPDQAEQLKDLTDTLQNAVNALAQALRGEMNSSNSIITNLASSITNINSTLNNLLAAIENLANDGAGLSDTDKQKLNNALDLVTEIRNILMGSRK